MIYSKLEPRITIFRKRRLPFWTQSTWHFDDQAELGHSVTRHLRRYIHIQNGREIAYTDHVFPPNLMARAVHWLMDGTPIGISQHIGEIIDHRDPTGKTMGITRNRGLRNGSIYVHEGDLSIAHYGGGVMLLLMPYRSYN